MKDYREYYDEKYITAFDLKGLDTVVTIREVRPEKVKSASGEATKPLVFFNEFEKGMVFNKTNGHSVAALYGSHVPNWVGKQITLYPTETTYNGAQKPCIRIRAGVPTPPAAEANGKEGKTAK